MKHGEAIVMGHLSYIVTDGEDVDAVYLSALSDEMDSVFGATLYYELVSALRDADIHVEERVAEVLDWLDDIPK